MIIKSILSFMLIHSVISDPGFRCDYTFFQEANGWLKINRFPMKWFDAKLRCMLEGARLASPTNVTFDSMKFLLDNTATDMVFTGINSLISKGYFNTLEGVHAENCIVLQNWAQGEPNNSNGNERCVSLNGNGQLADVDCDMSLPFICYRKKTGKETMNRCGTIDNKYEYNGNTKTCHKIHTEGRNYSQAFMTCQAEGGHLAIVNSDQEVEALKILLNRYPTNNIKGSHNKDFYFLGFHADWFKDREFMTIEDQTFEEAGSKFASGQPDNNSNLGEYCGCIYRGTTQLHDIRCSSKLGFICEIDPTTLC